MLLTYVLKYLVGRRGKEKKQENRTTSITNSFKKSRNFICRKLWISQEPLQDKLFLTVQEQKRFARRAQKQFFENRMKRTKKA